MKSFLFIIPFAYLISGFVSTPQVKVQKLKCEYLVNPIGIDAVQPRFTWQLISEESGVEQREYKIFVGTDSSAVASGNADTWDPSPQENHTIPVIYHGPELQPLTKYFWSVKVQTEDGNWSDPSEVASFETGFMHKASWKGQWITDTYDYNIKPAQYFRKEFNAQKKIKSARAYIAVAGLYELYLNGNRIGDHRLDPMYTRFDRRTLYVTYDVTDKLKPGGNAIGVLLGNGWYNLQSTAVWYFDKAPWRSRPKFCMDLKIVYDDGTQETIATDQDWKTSPSPIILNSIYTAEHYDARLEQPGWNMPGYNDSKWEGSLDTGAPSENITAQVLHPIRNVEKLEVSDIKQFSKTDYVADFGRNISGVIRIKVSGEPGTVIRLIHAEKLNKEGHADQSNINVHYRPSDDSDPFQTDILILSGNKEDEFTPAFNYKGFRYVEIVSDKPVNIGKENLSAYFMHSDVPPVGTINSSNKTLNSIWKASDVSYLSNLFGYPTDCPQREKNGWTGDAQINIETGLYNFDGITVYEKWLADHRDEQQSDGILPAIIPSSGWGYHWANGPDWTSTIAIIPWNIYLFYGDSRLLEECYDNIKRYVDHINEKYPSGITDWGLGDWVPVKSVTPKEFTSTAYYFADVTILAKAAKLTGKAGDAEKYFRLAEKIKNAFNEKYLDKSTGTYDKGYQTEQSVALFWGLVPQEYISKTAERLAERVKTDNDHIDVGLLGTKTILNALSSNGYAGLAYKVASQETYPSWGWWIVNGATTFYENWPVDASNDNSLNHIMFGEINAWYYKGLGGIFPDENAPGFKNVILKPHFPDGLESFKAEHEGPYGKIISGWERLKGKIIYHTSIPAGSTAILFLDAKKVNTVKKNAIKVENVQIEKAVEGSYRIQLKSGNYDFEIIR